MVQYKRVIAKHWPVNGYQQWYQSTRSDLGRRQLQYNSTYTHNSNFLKRISNPNTPYPAKAKTRISPEGKRLLKQKVQEVVSFNSTKTHPKQTLTKTENPKSLAKKDKRARCYVCKKRGHVYWKCMNQGKVSNPEKVEVELEKPMKEMVEENHEAFKYEPETVHVMTDFMVEGSDQGSWDDIWYVSSMYKKHMTPMKHLFNRMIQRFKVEGVEEKQNKFIVSYGIGEARVYTNQSRLVISNVLYTPEITLNILSLDQLEEQGYIVTYGKNTCTLKYMFDEAFNENELDVIEEEDEETIKQSHNKFLDCYFKSLDLNEECTLIRGMENLKLNKGITFDYIDNDYVSLNGTLYFLKVNTFPRFISFLDLLKIDRMVYQNWETLKEKFVDMLFWFYIEFLDQSYLGELPPKIGVIKIDLLALYKFVDTLGGYMNVTVNEKWGQVASLLGLAYDDHEAVKDMYKEYIGMVDLYYKDAKMSEKPEVDWSDGSEHARITEPQAVVQDMGDPGYVQDEVPKKRLKTAGMEEMLQETEGETSRQADYGMVESSTTSTDDFIIIV